ncbi:uncharacterized protein LOC113789873 isoform X2 [Dermatophagoides pteronyssinus]
MAKQDDNNYRLLMISIDNEVNRMVMKYTMTKQADWKSDYQLFLAEKIDSQDNRPFFVLINIDLDDELKWVMVQVKPSSCCIKDKLFSSSAKIELKKSFGPSLDLFVDDYDDLSVEKIEEAIKTGLQEKKEIAEEKQQKQNETFLPNVKFSYLQPKAKMNLELAEVSETELAKFKNGNDYGIRFIIAGKSKIVFDGKLTLDEHVSLAQRWNVNQTEQLEKIIFPENTGAGYILLRFNYEMDDNLLERFILINYMPTNNTLLAKERFSYSANLKSMVDMINSKLDTEINYLETDNFKEITVKRIFDLLYPSLYLDMSGQKPPRNE